MKTYDERMQSILKKAKMRKGARQALKAVAMALCIALAVFAVKLLPSFEGFRQMDVPAFTSPSMFEAEPTMGSNTTCSLPTMTPSSAIPAPQEPDATAGPPSPNDKPTAYLDFEATYLNTTQPSACDSYPASHLLRSVEDLSTFCAQRDQPFIRFETVMNQAEKYDAAFFEENSLIVLMIEEGSGSIRHTVVAVDAYSMVSENDVVNIEIARSVPEIGTCDMAYWYIFVEVPVVLEENTWICFSFVNAAVPPLDQTVEPMGAVDQIADWEQEKMRDVFIFQFANGSDEYSVDEVIIDRVVANFGRRFALFVDGIFAYLDCMESEFVNGYEFIYGSSQKMYLYYDGHYYRLQEAYDEGLLSDDELQQLYCNYLTEYWFYYADE